MREIARPILLGATVLAALVVISAQPARAQSPGPVADAPVPPLGIGPDAARKVLERANPQNSPIAGAPILPGIAGGAHPPSLEAPMAARPGVDPKSDLAPARAEELPARIHRAGPTPDRVHTPGCRQARTGIVKTAS